MKKFNIYYFCNNLFNFNEFININNSDIIGIID